MKLIEKKEQKKVPELIWGAKYKMLRDNEWHSKGETVLLCSTKLDYDAEVPVYSESEEGWAEPEDLQLITEEVEETAEKAEPTYVIEFTESELKMLYASVGTSNNNKRNELLSSEKLNPDNSLQHFDDVELYRGLREVLQGEDK